MWLPIILKVQVNRHRGYDRCEEGGYPSKRKENGVQRGAGTWPVVAFSDHEHHRRKASAFRAIEVGVQRSRNPEAYEMVTCVEECRM